MGFLCFGRSHKLISNCVIFLLLLLRFFSLSSGSFGLQLTSPRGMHKPRPHPADEKCEYDCLPAEEVHALQSVLAGMGSKPLIKWITPSFCHGNRSSVYSSFNCHCEGGLCNIIEIIVQGSQIDGVIDDAFSKFKFLRVLDLSFNKLHGIIPSSLGKLSMLQQLVLSNNQLTGTIPATLQNLTSLRLLYLDWNLLQGSIPPFLGDMSSLTDLALDYNALKGEIPIELTNLTRLGSLFLRENQLSGQLPLELGNFKHLRILELCGNNFTGKIPYEYAKLTNLEWLCVAGNSLSGRIPEYITKMDKLSWLYLSGNNFEALPIGVFYDLPNLQYLWVSDLRLNRSDLHIPESANLTNLKELVLRNCSINGVIPSQIGEWSSLQSLDLSFNKLTGQIPFSMKNLSQLKYLMLAGNKLNGSIPSSTNNASLFVDLSYNDFTIQEPNNLNVSNVTLSNRSFVDRMSNEYCRHNNSQHNSLFINCGGAKTNKQGQAYDGDDSTSNFHVTKDRRWAYTCSGEWFGYNLWDTRTCEASDFYCTSRICSHSLTYYGFCLHNGNYTLTLHFKRAFYAHDAYGSLRTRVFDIYIQGNRVQEDFSIIKATASPNKLEHDIKTMATVRDNVLRINLFWAGKGSTLGFPYNGPLLSGITVTSDTKAAGGLPTIAKVALIVSSVAVFIILLALIWLLLRGRNKELHVPKLELLGGRYSVKQVINATRNFSSANEIGSGRLGKVYKAVLPDANRTIVAVKKLSPESKKIIEQIKQEVSVQKTLRHKNLLKLLDGDSYKNLHLLIYEFMENGSLKEALFGHEQKIQPDEWKLRFKICLGIAEGLEYLHRKGESFVHRDIKPSNILLDSDLNPKISDFRLAKLYNEDEDNPFNFIKEIRIQGYTAPEYYTRKGITSKADVYSYGIILLEIISGREVATREADRETVYLSDRANILSKNKRLWDLIDNKLSTNSEDRRQAIIILELAVMCIHLTPALRPSMADIVAVLNGTNTIDNISQPENPA